MKKEGKKEREEKEKEGGKKGVTSQLWLTGDVAGGAGSAAEGLATRRRAWP